MEVFIEMTMTRWWVTPKVEYEREQFCRQFLDMAKAAKVKKQWPILQRMSKVTQCISGYLLLEMEKKLVPMK